MNMNREREFDREQGVGERKRKEMEKKRWAYAGTAGAMSDDDDDDDDWWPAMELSLLVHGSFSPPLLLGMLRREVIVDGTTRCIDLAEVWF